MNSPVEEVFDFTLDELTRIAGRITPDIFQEYISRMTGIV